MSAQSKKDEAQKILTDLRARELSDDPPTIVEALAEVARARDLLVGVLVELEVGQ